MFGRDTHTRKRKKPFEPRPFRTISLDEVLTPIPELGTEKPNPESYFWWMNPEDTITLEDIATLSQYHYVKEFTNHTHSEK